MAHIRAICEKFRKREGSEKKAGIPVYAGLRSQEVRDLQHAEGRGRRRDGCRFIQRHK